MKKFLQKLALLLMIPVSFQLIGAALIPLNQFTFRHWEAVRVFFPLLEDGPFYPNQHLEMIEIGDLGKGTTYAIPRPTIFITDQYGFRNTPSDVENYHIVIVGDSMTVGSGLTQTDTVSAVLASQFGDTTYNYAPADLMDFLSESRFQVSPPHTVILQVVERNLLTDFCPQSIATLFSSSTTNMETQQLKVLLDRTIRTPFYFREYVRSNFLMDPKIPIVNAEEMIFLEKAISQPNEAAMTMEEAIDSLRRCDARLAERGLNFIFLPVPDKENIFFDMIPPDVRPSISIADRRQFLEDFIATAQAEEITTVDLLTAYIQARNDGVNPYQLDDTHWNPTGVEIAVEQLLPFLES